MPRPKNTLARELAARYGVSVKTILRNAAYARGIDVIRANWGLPIVEAILNAQIRITKRSVILLGQVNDRCTEPGFWENLPVDMRDAMHEFKEARRLLELRPVELDGNLNQAAPDAGSVPAALPCPPRDGPAAAQIMDVIISDQQQKEPSR